MTIVDISKPINNTKANIGLLHTSTDWVNTTKKNIIKKIFLYKPLKTLSLIFNSNFNKVSGDIRKPHWSLAEIRNE